MKKNIRNVVFILLLLTLAVSTAFLTYLHFFMSGGETLSGEWRAELDMTESAAATAYSWLRDIEGVSVSLEDMEARMQNLTIQVRLSLGQTDRSAGTFQCNVVPESYEACQQAAYEAFAAAFQELLAERLHMAGYTGSMDGDAIEALVTETFGMSTEEYLLTCGPDLLPPLDELQAEYGGSGTYETAEGVMTRQYDDGGAVTTRAESYVCKDSILVLSEEIGSVPAGFSSDDYPVVYILAEPQEK